MAPSATLSAIIVFAWISVKTQPSLITVSVFFVFFNGTIQAALPAAAYLAPELSKIGTRMGMTLSAAGLGLLIGFPIAGAILDGQSTAETQEFWGVLTYSGLVSSIDGVGLVVARIMKVGTMLQKA